MHRHNEQGLLKANINLLLKMYMPRAWLPTMICPVRNLWFITAPCFLPQNLPKLISWWHLKWWDLLEKHISRQHPVLKESISIIKHFSLEQNRWSKALGFKSLWCHQGPRYTIIITLQHSNTIPLRTTNRHSPKRQVLQTLEVTHALKSNPCLSGECKEKQSIMEYIKLPEMSSRNNDNLRKN